MGMRFMLATLPALCLLAACGEPDAVDTGAVATAKKGGQPKVAFTAEGVVLDGRSVALPGELSMLIAVLGEPTRTLPLANAISVWDDAGVYAMAKPGTARVHTFAVAFYRTTYPYAPKTLHAGTIQVGGHPIGPRPGKKQIEQAGFRASELLPMLLERKLSNVKLTLETDPDSGRLITLEASFEGTD